MAIPPHIKIKKTSLIKLFEAENKKTFTDYLKLCGFKVYRQDVGLKFNMNGTPTKIGEEGDSDLRCERENEMRMVFVEVKRPKLYDKEEKKTYDAGKPTVKQLQYLASKLAMGHVAFVAWTLYDIYDNLISAGYKVPHPDTLKYRSGRGPGGMLISLGGVK